MTSASKAHRPSVGVGVVSICSARHLARCLDALAQQVDCGAFEIVVAFDPALDDVAALARCYPKIRFVSDAAERTPLELAARAVRETSGEVVLLTEDHCVPASDWVARLSDAVLSDCSAAGGAILADPRADAIAYAFYFVDFFRYAPPFSKAESPTLSVCNVGYRRERLKALGITDGGYFHETAVNDALRAAYGPLLLDPSPRVTMHRHVRFSDAVYERYAFGRLFGCTRLDSCSNAKAWLYRLGTPLLPLLLMTRMCAKGLVGAEARRRFLPAFLPTLTMVLAWSWGEWLGYLTARRPRHLTVAREIR